MKRLTPFLTVVLSLTVALAPAQAHHGRHGRDGGTTTAGASVASQVHGVVVSTDATAGTISVTLAGGTRGGHGCSGHGKSSGQGQQDPGQDAAASRQAPAAATPVTIVVGPGTVLTIDGKPATLSNFAAGTAIGVALDSSTTTSLTAALALPALSVTGFSPLQFSGFAGTVAAVDPAAGTVSVTVTTSIPATAFPAGSAPVTFTVGAGTRVIAGGAVGALSAITVGDVVAGGLVGAVGLTPVALGTTPLLVLIDVPAGSAPSAVAWALHAAQRAAGAGSGGRQRRSHRHARRHR